MAELVLLELVATITVLLADMLRTGMAQIVSVSAVQLALELAVVLQRQPVAMMLLSLGMDDLEEERRICSLIYWSPLDCRGFFPQKPKRHPPSGCA